MTLLIIIFFHPRIKHHNVLYVHLNVLLVLKFCPVQKKHQGEQQRPHLTHITLDLPFETVQLSLPFEMLWSIHDNSHCLFTYHCNIAGAVKAQALCVSSVMPSMCFLLTPCVLLQYNVGLFFFYMEDSILIFKSICFPDKSASQNLILKENQIKWTKPRFWAYSSCQ